MWLDSPLIFGSLIQNVQSYQAYNLTITSYYQYISLLSLKIDDSLSIDRLTVLLMLFRTNFLVTGFFLI